MTYFIIIELDDGNSIVECPAGEDPMAVAEACGGVLVDEGPYTSYEDAGDALDNLEPEDDERGVR